VNILLTGCCGFIGSNLSRALIKEGHTLYGVDDLSVGKKEYVPNGVPILCQQVDHYSFMKTKFPFKELDMVIHLASRKIPREGHPDVVLRENVMGMINVVRLAQKYDARVIFTSTSDIYGMTESGIYGIPEIKFSKIGPPFVTRWSYAVSKMWNEQYLCGTEGLKFNIVRLFATYGEYNCMTWRAGPIPVFIDQAIKKEPITIHGDGQQTRCFQYVSDAVDGIIRVMNYGEDREIYNIGNPVEPISILDLASRIWDMINGSKPFMPPITAVEPIKGKVYQEVLNRKPNISKAENNLDFKPKVTLDEGLEKTIKWHRKNLQ